MFAPHIPGLPRPHRLRRLHRLEHIAGPVLAFAEDATRRDLRRRRARVRRREPSMLMLLLAGLAVVAFVKVMTAASGRKRTAERLVLWALLLVLGAIVLSLRRSSARYRA